MHWSDYQFKQQILLIGNEVIGNEAMPSDVGGLHGGKSGVDVRLH